MNKRQASILLAGVGLALVALSIVLYLNWEAGGGPQIQATQTAQAAMFTGKDGFFQLGYRPDSGKIPLNSLHSWTIHLQDSSGQPVSGAQIAIDGRMPAHGHGLPTRPLVTADLGGGDYRVEGLRFQMSGEWVVEFTVQANGLTDIVPVTFTLR